MNAEKTAGLAFSLAAKFIGCVVKLSPQKRILMQKKGISARHPILTLSSADETVVCSIASREGNSSFDYSLLLPQNSIDPSMSDEEAISVICCSEKHKRSAWGWALAISHGVAEEDILDLFPLINIPDPRKIRLSRATREVQQNQSPHSKERGLLGDQQGRVGREAD